MFITILMILLRLGSLEEILAPKIPECLCGMVAVEKCDGPSVCIVFLGIELDSVKMEMHLL